MAKLWFFLSGICLALAFATYPRQQYQEAHSASSPSDQTLPVALPRKPDPLPAPVETKQAVRSSIAQAEPSLWRVVLHKSDGWFNTGVNLTAQDQLVFEFGTGGLDQEASPILMRLGSREFKAGDEPFTSTGIRLYFDRINLPDFTNEAIIELQNTSTQEEITLTVESIRRPSSSPTQNQAPQIPPTTTRTARSSFIVNLTELTTNRPRPVVRHRYPCHH
jgi:hypothetical protein